MAIPTLTPVSTTSAITLPSTGTPSLVAASCPIGVYTGSTDFLSGASDQVAYTYQKLGGDILDIELTTGSVYAAYEEAVLEYSYIVNMHQSKNILSDVLGMTTGTFDHDGESLTGDTNVALKYPKTTFAYNQKMTEGFSGQAGIGAAYNIYSASFAGVSKQQEYDLYSILSSSAATNVDPASGSPVPYAGMINGKKIVIEKVYYKTPQAMWRFFGYYGGLNTVGNLSNYGQYADDSTFQLIPVWQNKAQAMAFEDSIYTRNSHYSFELHHNKLVTPAYYWFDFRILGDAWDETNAEAGAASGVDGINNMNTLPFANIPYANVNSIGKQWIRRFALALCKETLGQTRSKFATIPIPGESVTLNGSALISEGRETQT
ncbi:MAG: hypothetical protein ACYSW3_27000, partial [Planctomycetota bacterium]